MKSAVEILPMLIDELISHIDGINFINHNTIYYNETLGDTSFLLAGLLDSLLKNIDSWDRRKWLDDSLITKIENQNHKITIDGIMIFGMENTTEQWTAPFSFEIQLLRNSLGFKRFIFSFYDANTPEVSYEIFKDNRNYWNQHSSNWKYIIDSNKDLN